MMGVKTRILNWCKALALPVAVWAIFAVITKGRFATLTSILSVFRTGATPVLIGMTLGIGMLMNMWNFAAGAIIYACAIFGAYFADLTGTGVPGLCVFPILTGVVLCAAMGILYRLLRVPCLVLSLGMIMVVEALPYAFVPSATGKISLLDGYLASAPYCYIIVIIMFVIFYFVNHHTTLGADMKVIGANIKIAQSAGVDIDRVKFLSFLLSGLFLGVAGIITMSTNVTLSGVTGIASVSLIFDGFMGVFVAMVLMKYVNYSASVVIGTITIRLLGAGLVACGFSSNVRGILTGVFLFVVVTFSANSDELAKARGRKKLAEEVNAEYEIIKKQAG